MRRTREARSATRHVTADQTDPDPSNNASTKRTTVPAVADLEVTKVADATATHVGDLITYTITLVNHEPADATSVSVSDDAHRLTIRTRIQAGAVGTEIANHAAVVAPEQGEVSVLVSRERRGGRHTA